MKKIDHIGIAVKNLADAEKTYSLLLNTPSLKKEKIESENVEVCFFKTNDTKIELLQALSPESPIATFIEKKGEGIHHIAFEVDDIETEIIRLCKNDFMVIGTPKKGADNKLIVFLHPKKTHGVLIELCQKINPK